MADETNTDDRTTKDRATDVATTARDEAGGVADDVRSEAAAVVSEAGTQARALADEARDALRQQASDGTSRAAGAVDQLAERLRALADGNTDQAGELQRYARDLGDRLGGVAGRMQERGLDGLMNDVQTFARRRPGLFLAAAAGAGFAAGRVFRGAKADAESSTNGGSSGNGHGLTTSRPAVGSATSASTVGPSQAVAGGSAAGSSASVAAGPTTAPSADPGRLPDPSTDEQLRATELSGFRPDPTDRGVEPAGPDGGTTPAPTPYGGASGERGGAR